MFIYQDGFGIRLSKKVYMLLKKEPTKWNNRLVTEYEIQNSLCRFLGNNYNEWFFCVSF